MGTVTALNTFCRQLGGACLVAAFGAILVAGGAGSAVIAEGAAVGRPTDPALGSSFRWIFLSAAAVVAAACAAVAVMRELPLKGREEPAGAEPAPTRAG